MPWIQLHHFNIWLSYEELRNQRVNKRVVFLQSEVVNNHKVIVRTLGEIMSIAIACNCPLQCRGCNLCPMQPKAKSSLHEIQADITFIVNFLSLHLCGAQGGE